MPARKISVYAKVVIERSDTIASAFMSIYTHSRSMSNKAQGWYEFTDPQTGLVYAISVSPS